MVTTPIAEAWDGDASFYGKRCVAVLVSTPNHWMVYVKVEQNWWCLDSVQTASFLRNPFHHQSARHIIMQMWFSD